jgi:hypothetical protein
MYHSEYKKALDLITEIHKRNRSKINPSNKDVKLAIYYLQGGCITQANFALKAWAIGDLNTPFRAKRFIDESKLLIFCLISVNDKDRERYLRQFFKDEILTIKPKKHENDILTRTGMEKDYFDTWLKHAETLSHGFSKGVHPNLEAVAYNSNIDTGEFDYEAINFAYYPITNFDFAHYIIIPAIDSVFTASGLFEIKEEEFKEVLEIRDKIQSIAKIKLGK